MSLSNFPVDDSALNLLEAALDSSQTGRSSLFEVLDLYSELGGSDTAAVEEKYGDSVHVMRDPQYSTGDVIMALIDEIRRLRTLLHKQFEENPT